MLNELQQRYLSQEGEKYTFYPIINNYIIKYNRPYFPSLSNSEIYGQEAPLTSKYNNNLNNSNNFNKIKNFNSIIQETATPPHNYTDYKLNKSLKRSFNNNNAFLISIGDTRDSTKTNSSLNKKKMFKKIDKYNISNYNRYNKNNIQKKNINNNSTLYENKTNLNGTKKININNAINQDIKLQNKRDTFSEEQKLIQKNNSIQNCVSNNPQINHQQPNKKINKNKPKINKKYLNNIVRINIPLEELYNYNSNIPIKKSHMNMNINNIRSNYLNKRKDIKNNSNNKVNAIKGFSLKNLIQDEKAKKHLKQRNSKNISKEKAKKIIDNIFNNNKKYMKTSLNNNNNNLMINVEDYNLDDLNINSKNVPLRSENFCTLEEIKDNNVLKNKNIKTENNYKKINIKNRINIQKSYEKDINPNSRIIALTDQPSKDNRKYYNKNTFNKNFNSSFGQNDNLISLTT